MTINILMSQLRHSFSVYMFTVLFVVVNVLAFRAGNTDPRTSTAGDVGLLTVALSRC